MKLLLALTTIVDIGGISSSISNLLQEISKDKELEITIIALNNYITPRFNCPDSVKILKGSKRLEDCFVSRKLLQNQSIVRRVIRNFRRCMKRVLGTDYIIRSSVKKLTLNAKFDVAIAFTNDLFDAHGKITNGGCYQFVLNKVDAKKKIAWIHNEPSECGFTHEICLKAFRGFDAIVNVSFHCKNAFDVIAPEFKDKSYVVYNLYDLDRTRLLSEEKNPYTEYGDVLNFVTVARLYNHQKRQDRILKAIKELELDKRTKIHWTFVGDGPDKAYLMNIAKEYGIENTVSFVGLKSNPYPYMKFADAFVLTSLYEGYGMTIKEAQIVGTPTIITEFGCAMETVENGKTGIICGNTDDSIGAVINGIIVGIIDLSKLRSYLQNNPVDNSIAISQFKKVIECK